jgi:excisionase family DNA binding protein
MTRRRDYFRAREIVALTGLSLRTVRRRIADQTLRSEKWGGARLIPVAELEPSQKPALWDVDENDDENEESREV